MMDEFCGSKFWDLNLTWYSDEPQLTECFEKTVLSWIPAVFLVIFGPLDIMIYNKNKASKTRGVPAKGSTVLSTARFSLCIILGLIQIIQLCDALKYKYGDAMNPPAADVVGPFVKFFAFMAALALASVSKLRGVPSSGVQLGLWFVVAICELLPYLRNLHEYRIDVRDTQHYSVVVLLKYSYFPLIVIQFLLFCWADNPADKELHKNSSKSPCPEKQSSALSRLLFSWFDSFTWRGFRKPLEESDLWDLDYDNTAEVIARKYEANWEAEANKNSDCSQNGVCHVGVGRVVIKTFRSYLLIGAAITVVPGLLDVAGPRIASMLLGFISSDEEQWKGYMYAFLLFLTSMIAVLVRGQYAHMMYMTGFRVKTALMSAVYKKALRISHGAKRDASVGEIVNLMTVDVQKVVQVLSWVNTTWDCPVQIAVAFYLLWNTIGPSSLAGISVIILLMPMNIFLGKLATAYQASQMKHKDERVKLITEVIRGLKVIKLHAWEESFEAKVQRVRNEEVNSLQRFDALGAVNEFMWFGSQCFVVLATFTTYVLSNEENVLDAHTIFVTLALTNAITVPLTLLPKAIIICLQAKVSLGRLNKFLNADEVGARVVEHGEKNLQCENFIYPTEHAISLSGCNFGWSRKPSTEALKNVDLHIPEGALVAVVGPVGSGKSSLVAAILGELEKYGGTVNVNGSISYVAQEAWVQHGIIRNNILFGRPYEHLKYKTVVEACCLLKDFEIFAQRDETLVEERGMNLSGGQRQRISLARAVYDDADIYLLDDPLSAVDPEVGQKIFDNIIGPNGLLRRKTRVLVTHNVQFLPMVDKIVVMNKGEVSQVGTYSELQKEEGAFSKYLLEYAGDDLQDDSAHRNVTKSAPGSRPYNVLKRRSFRSRVSADAAFEESSFICKQRTSSVVSSNSKSNHEGNDESFETTSVSWSMYLDYFRAGSFKLMLPSVAMYFMYQGFAVGANASLTAWSSEPIVNGTQGHQGFYLGVYATLGGLQSLALLTASLLVSNGSLRASSVLHNRLLKRIMRAPMWFFDTIPTGRLICRFGKDVDVLDTTMTADVRMWLAMVVSVFATFATILYTVPMFIAIFVPAAGVYILVQKLYIPTSLQLRRLESVTQAPLYSYFGESILGITTIRAFGQQKRFFREALRRIDRHQRCYFLTQIANRWLILRLGTVSSIIKFSVALFAVMERGTLSPGLAGLCINYAINVTFYLGQLVRSCCDVETDIVSVERIQEYCCAPQENPWKLSYSPSSSWPTSGCISFNKYETNYREGLDLVLKCVNCTIEAGEKIGVVGRTGAGKSSLVLALFRIIEPVCGEILIDDQDISKVGLHDLRARLTIIPQDPVLFSGTLRFNLDPFQKFTDDAVWRALELAHLRDVVTDIPGQLNYEISEGGIGFSVGQKQQVCLARSLLRKSKILVLDEATASVDLETDSLIQETIRKEFTDCTVVTIAHRLKTVMNCDRVMVVDSGTIREFDRPGTLLQVHNSRFYVMAKDSGLVER